MSQLETIFLTLATVLAAFLVLTAVLHRHYPRQRYMLWMMVAIGTMALGFVSGFLLDDTKSKVLAVVALYTAAALLTCQTILVLTGSKRRFPLTLLPSVALAMATAVTEIAGYAFVYNTIPFHLACALPLVEAGFRMLNQEDRKTADRAIVFCIFFMAALFSLRGFGFAFLFDTTTSYAQIEGSRYAMVTILAMALPGFTLMLLLIFRMLDTAASHYRQVSETDPLTGLLNRTAFADRATGCKTGTYLILCDLDRFKRVNDTWGHNAGDSALRTLAGLFHEINLVAARIGGEEFAILLQNATIEQARLAAEGLRTAFSLQMIDGLPESERLTASFGVAAFADGESLNSVFHRADKALYRAKNAGRDRVVVATELKEVTKVA